MPKYEITSISPAATMSLGKKIGRHLEPGDVIALIGELGCGKTLLTKGICDGLGMPERQVNSPTFVLVNEYRGRLPVFHVDLYRLSGIDDGFEIGITDYLSRAREGIMIIEWAEKIIDLLPPDLLKVEFDIISIQKRHIVFSSTSRRFA
ncbi:MAG: tRNA (adenosine(37)-N6)-threonylcarbamoyltransferase complex ATPase subunit type 1 TsaE, partial [Dehalococcoidales bacterium]|nr:tRNA (adenosine(37)-N6)-threonylcarbamoyltransferase complex ATPase subunit type 1 TsaE [Dehalococcoidales bacterium]